MQRIKICSCKRSIRCDFSLYNHSTLSKESIIINQIFAKVSTKQDTLECPANKTMLGLCGSTSFSYSNEPYLNIRFNKKQTHLCSPNFANVPLRWASMASRSYDTGLHFARESHFYKLIVECKSKSEAAFE